MTKFQIRALSIFSAVLAVYVNTWEPHGILIDVAVGAVCVLWQLRAAGMLGQ